MADEQRPAAPAAATEKPADAKMGAPAAPPKKMEFKLLGHNYVTPDLVAKVTGQARYAEDFRAPGMAFIKLMPSPRPHAKIRSIDDRAARAMEGVLEILTWKDLPAPPAPPGGPPAGAPAGGRGGAAPAAGAAGGAAAPAAGAGAGAAAPAAAPAAPPAPPMPPEFALTEEPVYEGEPILAVAAISEEIASEAIEK